MINIKFVYLGKEIIIQSSLQENIEKNIESFITKSGLYINQLYFLYNGAKITQNSTLEELLNETDKERKTMNILVEEILQSEIHSFSKTLDENDFLIKCANCVNIPEITKLVYKNNSVFITYKCKNQHYDEDVEISKFLQKICIPKENEYNCSFCFSFSDKNKFLLFCNKCKKIICNNNLCMLKHNSSKECGFGNNYLISAYNIEKICSAHGDKINFYCINCEKSFCYECEEHKNHNNIPIKNLKIDKSKIDDIITNINNGKKQIEKLSKISINNENLNNALKSFIETNLNLIFLLSIIIKTYQIKEEIIELIKNINFLNINKIFDYNLPLEQKEIENNITKIIQEKKYFIKEYEVIKPIGFYNYHINYDQYTGKDFDSIDRLCPKCGNKNYHNGHFVGWKSVSGRRRYDDYTCLKCGYKFIVHFEYNIYGRDRFNIP